MPIRALRAVLALVVVCLVWPSGSAIAQDVQVAVSGVVRDTEGGPVAGADVVVYSADGSDDGALEPVASTQTDHAGSYVLTFPAGSYSLSVSQRDHHAQTLGARLGFDPVVGYEREFVRDEDIDVTMLPSVFPAVQIVEDAAGFECLSTSSTLRTVYCEYGYRYRFARGAVASEMVHQIAVGSVVVDRDRSDLDSYGAGFVLGGRDLTCGPEGITGAVGQVATVSIRAVPETGPAARHEVTLPVDGRLCRQVQISGVALRDHVAGTVRPRVTVRAVGKQRPGGVVRAVEGGEVLGQATLRVRKSSASAVLVLPALAPGRHTVTFRYEPSDPVHLDSAQRTIRWRLRAE